MEGGSSSYKWWFKVPTPLSTKPWEHGSTACGCVTSCRGPDCNWCQSDSRFWINQSIMPTAHCIFYYFIRWQRWPLIHYKPEVEGFFFFFFSAWWLVSRAWWWAGIWAVKARWLKILQMNHGTVHWNKPCLPTNIMERAKMLIEHKRANLISFTYYILQYWMCNIKLSSPIFLFLFYKPELTKAFLLRPLTLEGALKGWVVFSCFGSDSFRGHREKKVLQRAGLNTWRGERGFRLQW